MANVVEQKHTLAFSDGSSVEVFVCDEVRGKKRQVIHRWLEIRYVGGNVVVIPYSTDKVAVVLPSSGRKHPAMKEKR